MKRMIRRIFAVLVLLLWLPAGALALTGQNMTTFLKYYQEDVSFINANTGRHMLPVALDALDLNDNGRTQYVSRSDALQVTVTADAAGIIESCEIRLLFLVGAAQGNSLYQDFTTAVLHSLAFLMAMHVSAAPESRYLLGEEIRDGLAANFGAYNRQLGSYAIACVSVVGEGAVFTFTNNGLAPAETGPADEQQIPDTVEDDAGANLG
jgi:hypothetical protein